MRTGPALTILLRLVFAVLFGVMSECPQRHRQHAHDAEQHGEHDTQQDRTGRAVTHAGG